MPNLRSLTIEYYSDNRTLPDRIRMKPDKLYQPFEDLLKYMVDKLKENHAIVPIKNKVKS